MSRSIITHEDLFSYNPFKDADDINYGIRYCHEVFERIIPKITFQYNMRFGLNKTERFYSILLSSWLTIYIEQMLDKYNSIKNFSENNIETLSVELEKCIYPADQNHYTQLVAESDLFNNQTYCQILKYLSFPQGTVVLNLDKKNIVSLDYSGYSRRWFGFHPWEIIKKSSIFINKLFYKSSGLMSSTYSDRWAFGFCAKGLFRTVFDDIAFKDAIFDVKFNTKERTGPFWEDTEDDFETLLSAMFLQHCPASYLELFEELRNFVNNKYTTPPKFVYTATGIAANTLLTFMLAEHSDKTKILVHQHGGNYGTDALHSYEFLERRIADKYFTWGWSDSEETTPLASPALLPFQKVKASKNVSKGITLYLTCMPKVHFRLMQCNICADNFLKYYIQDVQKFLALIQDLHNSISIRGYPSSMKYGQGELLLLERDFDAITFEDFSMSFVESVEKSEICVMGHLATTQIQTMVAGKPTIIFLQKDLYKHREAAIPYFEALERAGVLHYTPESAAKKILEINQNPLAWWHQKDVAEAVQLFLSKYGKTSDDIDSDFRAEFKKYQ